MASIKAQLALCIFFLFPSFASFAYICIFHCILEAPICIIMWGKGEVVPPLLPNFRGAVGENVCSPPIGTQRLLVRVATKMFLVKTEGFLQKPNMGRNTGVIICTMDSLYIPAGSRPSASARDPAIDTQGSEWAFLRWAKGGDDVQPPVFRLPAGYAYSNAIPTMENDH